MEQFEKIFVHRPQNRIIICKRCKFAVAPSHVVGHIQAKHPSIPLPTRKAIAVIAKQIPDVAQVPEDVYYPPIADPAIPELPVYNDGLHCMAPVEGSVCNYICRKARGMATHCREQHQWENPRKPGGNPRARIGEATGQIWTEGQPCQQFFKTGKWQRYFAVQVAPSPDETPVVNIKEETDVWISQIIGGIKQAKKDAITDRNRYEANPWLEHTGWEHHLGAFRLKAAQYVQAIKIEGEGEGEDSEDAVEEALEQACKGTQTLIRRSFIASRIEIVGRHAMQCINRRENGAPSNNKPFYAKQKVQTIRKYTDVWVKVLRYIWRTERQDDRPGYRLTPAQVRALRRLQYEAGIDAEGSPVQGPPRPTAEEDVVNASLAFWIAMFDHPLADNEYDSGLLSGLAVLGANGEGGGWVPAINYTPMLAAMITTMRAIVIRRAWRIREDYILHQMRAGVDKATAQSQAPIIHQLVQKDVERFMVMTEFGGQPSPINTIYTQKMYGLKIRYTTNAAGQIGWTGDNQDIIIVRKVQFSMGQIRTVVHGLVDTVRQRMAQDLLYMSPGFSSWHPDALPRFNMSRIVDNHCTFDEGWSFLNDARNKWPVDGQRWMAERLAHDKAMAARFKADNTQVTLQPDAVEAHLRQVKRWKEEMLVLVHMSAGAPARATELVSIQRENGEHARSHRGIFIDQGMVVFVTSYHKGFSASQTQKCIHRFVPHEVGELIVYYLWLIEPFVQILQFSQGRPTSSSWFWEPAPEEVWEAEGAAEEAGEEEDEEEGEGEDIGVMDMPDQSPEVQSIRQQIKPAVAHNCDGFWETNRVRRVMRRECEKRIGVPIGISDWRQAYPAIHREFAINRDVVGTLQRIYDNDNPNQKAEASEEQTRESMRAYQSSHSPQMEEGIYGREIQQNPFSTRREQDAFREVSMDWHRWLQFPSSYDIKSISPDVKRRIKQEYDDQKLQRWQQMRSIDVEGQLKRMYGPEARFRGKQREALDAIVSGQPRIVVVMRTGGGKSLLFMLPAAASPDGVTIVVMPKVMLQEDMAARCRAQGIRCAIWSDNHAPPFDAQVVFVIAESAVTQTFADYINAKMLAQQLERVFVDECHSVLQSTPEFRPKVLQLRDLIGRQVQVVCLTATLPPRKEAAFMHTMDMEAKNVRIIRESTVRPNIAYSAVEYDGVEEEEFVQEYIRSTLARYPAEDRVIVYCRTIKQTEQFAEKIGGQVFYSQVGDIKKKREIVEMLTQGSERLFWSTSALGEGIDASTVRVVMHVGIVDNLDDFVQQSGRAGRDGVTASESIVLRRFNIGRDGQRRFASSGKEEGQMVEYLEGKRCRRVCLDSEMDGEYERIACRSGEEFCDVCRGFGRKRARVRTEDIEVGTQRVRRTSVDNATPVARRQEAQQRSQEVRRLQSAKEAAEEEEERRKKEQEIQEAASRRAFQQQEYEFQAQATEQRQRRIDHAGIVERITAMFDEWKRGCNVCRVRGFEAGHQGWKFCSHPNVEEDRSEIKADVEQARNWLFGVRWQKAWAACQTCWAPRGVCHAWEAVHDGGPSQYRRKKGRQCQYRGVLCEVAAIIMQASRGDSTEWIVEQASAARLDGDNAHQVWLGSVVKQDGLEMSGMCWFAYYWAKKAEEEGIQ